MELFDICDEQGNPTGDTVERSEAHAKRICHRTAHIQAGDEPMESALRELGEELGIKAEAADLDFAGTFRIRYEKEFHGRMFRDNEVAFVFVYQKQVDIADLTIQKEELDGVCWFDLEDTYEACKNHDQKFCVPIGGLETVRKYLKERIR